MAQRIGAMLPNGKCFASQNEKLTFVFYLWRTSEMRYAYEIQQDGTKTVHVFTDEANRGRWIAACPSTRGVLSGNSKLVKQALYRGAVIFEGVRVQVGQ